MANGMGYVSYYWHLHPYKRFGRINRFGKASVTLLHCRHVCKQSVMSAGQPEVQVAADERRTVGGGRGRGGRGGRGGRRGRRAASTAPEDQGAATSPAAVLKGTSKGKRKADHMEGSSAQQAKHAQHVLKRKDRAKPPTCPMCHSDTILACDKLEGVSFAELKMIMG